MDAAVAVERALAVAGQVESSVRAWAWLDPDAAAAAATAVDARPPDSVPLRGLTFGAKDNFDTADQPTGYGTPVHAGHRPSADAGAVALLRHAGAVLLGKTVTAELAMYSPGPTTNPHRTTHTPGGSSSGSAAAVACGMADVALGTQTAGSVIRPAAFCGVFGFRPGFGVVTVAGVKLVAPSLDTVGWFARSVGDLDAVRVVLTGRPPLRPADVPPRFAVVDTEASALAGEDTASAVAAAAEWASEAGAVVARRRAPAALDGLGAGLPVVMAYEAARALAWEHRCRREQLSAAALAVLDAGAATDPGEYDRVRGRAADALARLDELVFAGADVVLTAATLGEAPAGLSSTGDPRPCQLWSLLGLPALSVPGFTGSSGLPVGVQLVGRPGGEARLLAAGAWLAERLPPPPVPDLGALAGG